MTVSVQFKYPQLHPAVRTHTVSTVENTDGAQRFTPQPMKRTVNATDVSALVLRSAFIQSHKPSLQYIFIKLIKRIHPPYKSFRVQINFDLWLWTKTGSVNFKSDNNSNILLPSSTKKHQNKSVNVGKKLNITTEVQWFNTVVATSRAETLSRRSLV